MRKLIATGAAGLALATGSIALASTGLGTANAQEQAQQAKPDGQANRQGLRHRAAKGAAKVAADAIGIAPKDLVTELRAGASLSEVATAHGVAPSTVSDALVAAANQRIDEAVANGKLDAARAAEVKAKVPERVAKLMDRPFDGSRRPDAG